MPDPRITPINAGIHAGVPPSALRHWQQLHQSADIQFAPLPEWHQPPPPDWLVALGRFLGRIFEPVAQMFGAAWPLAKWALFALAAAALLWLIWRLAEPLITRLRLRQTGADTEDAPAWAPARAEAEALLADADALAAAGQFDQAAHLLLRRSVTQIASARPDWLAPASTAREIAGLAQLPERARAAFAAITARVESSRYALRPLGADDWQVARAAYADFALQRLAA